jgi:sugar lactone lactonase YvrE
MHDVKYTFGKIYRFAGTGIAGYSGDGEQADLAQLNGPAGLAIDKDDNVYIAEIHNHVIRKVDAITNQITTVAGCGLQGFSGDGGLAIHAMLNGPEGVFVDKHGNIYIADTYNQRIRRVDGRTGIITTIAGCGDAGYNGDGIQACGAMLNCPAGVVVDTLGNVYFNDYRNDRIRRIDLKGTISTFAGTGTKGYSGDEEVADRAQINDVYGMGIDQYDNIYIMDSLNFAVRKIDAKTKIIKTVVGKGLPGPITEFESISNSYIGRVTHEKGTIGMEAPHAVEISSNGNIFIADTGHYRIRMVDVKHDTVYTIAGNGEKGCGGNGMKALDASLCVHGIRMDSANNLYFNDFENHVVRVINFH